MSEPKVIKVLWDAKYAYTSGKLIRRRVIKENRTLITVLEKSGFGAGPFERRMRKHGLLFDTKKQAFEALASQCRESAQGLRQRAEGEDEAALKWEAKAKECEE